MSVGFKLYREVRDFAPGDLTSGELVVALTIADDARDETRRSWISLPLLCARTRLKPSGVRSALGKLAARGLEFRVAHGYGGDGRPMFALKGHAVDYVVPDMLKGAATAPPKAAPKPVDNSAKGDTTAAPLNGSGRLKGATVAHKGDTTAAPIGAQRWGHSVTPPLKEPKPSKQIPSTEEASVVTAPGGNGRPTSDQKLWITSGGKP
jgi:hypothetical protein